MRDTALWENLYSHKFGNDIWGDDAIATMNSRLAEDDDAKASGLKFGSGKLNSDGSSSGSSSASSSSQSQSPAPVDGASRDANKRQKLFLAYMDKVSGGFKQERSAFLGQGADKRGKADFQGCSEFNPLLIFSQDKQRTFEDATQKKDSATLAERDKENAKNRRVMVLIYRKGSKVDPARWPCPRFDEGWMGARSASFQMARTGATAVCPIRIARSTRPGIHSPAAFISVCPTPPRANRFRGSTSATHWKKGKTCRGLTRQNFAL